MENSLSTMSLDTLVNKLIDLSVSFGSKLLVALLVFFIGRWIVKKLNRLVINILTKRHVEASLAILMQIGASQPELAALVDELDSATDEARIQEIYNTILTTMADQCLTTPLIYTRQLAIYSDAVASYTFPTDASFTSVQNIHLN